MSLGRDHVKSPKLCHAIGKADIRSPASHIGCHCDASCLACLGDDFGLSPVLPRVQHLVREPLIREEMAQMFGRRNRACPDQSRTTVPADRSAPTVT